MHGKSEGSVAHLYNKAGLRNLAETEGNEISAGILHEEPRMCVTEEKHTKNVTKTWDSEISKHGAQRPQKP